MKSPSRRVIKSEEVKFSRIPEKIASGSCRDPGDVGKSRVRGRTTSDIDRINEAFAKKVQLVEQESYEKGLSDGIQKGRELQKNEAFHTLQSMVSLMKETGDLKKNILDKAEEQIIQLSLTIAEKVIHLEVTTNREVIRNVLKEAIRNIVDRENMKVRIHPQDFQYMMEIKSDFLQNFDGIKNIIFEEDVSIGRGGAIIETLFGEVDARLDQQYSEIKVLMTSSNR